MSESASSPTTGDGSCLERGKAVSFSSTSSRTSSSSFSQAHSRLLFYLDAQLRGFPLGVPVEIFPQGRHHQAAFPFSQPLQHLPYSDMLLGVCGKLQVEPVDPIPLHDRSWWAANISYPMGVGFVVLYEVRLGHHGGPFQQGPEQAAAPADENGGICA